MVGQWFWMPINAQMFVLIYFLNVLGESLGKKFTFRDIGIVLTFEVLLKA
jgi:hypothetical protein